MASEGAAAAAPAARAPAGRRRSTDWLARLLRQYEQGVHTDVVIRVRVVSPNDVEQQEQEESPSSPAAKRRRTASSAAAAGADRFTDIKAHAVVLCACSAYFEKALGGDWAEAAERRVELTVPNEQAVEDLKLLIKLSYSDSYTHEGGQLLPLATRLRLAERADSLEFVEAVGDMVESIPLGLDFEAAQTCLDALPPTMKQHPGMGTVRSKVMSLLITGIEELEGEGDEGEAAMAAAVDALARCLGPVAGMFAVSETGEIVLRNDVQQLPLCVFKRLLVREALQLQTENEAHPLLVFWLQNAPVESAEAKEMFNALAPTLRYHHMTPDFLAGVVSTCKWMLDSGLLLPVLCSAIVQRGVPAAVLGQESAVARGRANRGVGYSEAVWEVRAEFGLEELKRLGIGENSKGKYSGFVTGYETFVQATRGEDGDDGFGILFDCIVPNEMHRGSRAAPGPAWLGGWSSRTPRTSRRSMSTS